MTESSPSNLGRSFVILVRATLVEWNRDIMKWNGIEGTQKVLFQE